MKKYYDTLGLSEEASTDEIKKAYRALSKKFHPDLNQHPDSEKENRIKFQEINEAYTYLKNHLNKEKAKDSKFKYNYESSYKEKDTLIYSKVKSYIKDTQLNKDSVKFPEQNLVKIEYQNNIIYVRGFFYSKNWVDQNLKTEYTAHLKSNLSLIKIDFIKSSEFEYSKSKIKNIKKQKQKIVINSKSILYMLFFASLIIFLTIFHNIRSTYYPSKSPYTDKKFTKNPLSIDFYGNLTKELRLKMDFENPVTREFYTKLASNSPGKYNAGQIAYIYYYLFNNWKYVNDPRGHEYYAKASESINNGLSGDCDDFAILISTCIEGIGGRSRIIIADREDYGHAYAEVFISNDSYEASSIIKKIGNYSNRLYGSVVVETLHYRTDSDGGVWLNLDWNNPTPGGEYEEAIKEIILYVDTGKYVKS